MYFHISFLEIEKNVLFKISLCKIVLNALKGGCEKCLGKLGADLAKFSYWIRAVKFF